MIEELKSRAVYTEPNHVVYCGHTLDILRLMPNDSIDLVMTSPPYW